MLKVIGARQNNLKNITVSIPKNALVVVTGVSGSGKSSLAFDTIFSEAQREFIDSLSSYAKRSIPSIAKADVDAIEGLTPCIVIDQHPLGRNPRSTVGTSTDMYTYLRLLYARMGTPIMESSEFSFNRPSGACETCKGLGFEIIPDLEILFDFDKSLNEGAILHKTWKINSRYWNIIKASSFFEMDKILKKYNEEERKKLFYSNPVRTSNAQPGYVQSFSFEGVVSRLLKRQNDSRGLTGNSYDEKFFSKDNCHSCKGARINALARSVLVNNKSIVDLVSMDLVELFQFLNKLKGKVAEAIVPYMLKLLKQMIDAGLGYLNLNRTIGTLSAGESQRLKLARQLGSSLTGLTYVLDEPTNGLHPSDTQKLISILKQLRDKGNSVIVVEHDIQLMMESDYIIDMGPGAGKHGGNIIGLGIPDEILKLDTPTGLFLSGRKKVERPLNQIKQYNEFLIIEDAKLHNLKHITAKFPKNSLSCLTGVSGSGKSSLMEVFLKKYPQSIAIDQTPVGSNSRSIPATYTKVFDDIRKEFAQETGTDPSLLTFNSSGACKECNGLGYKTMDMHFLGDIQELCTVCKGKRYLDSVLQYKYKDKSISDVLDMTVDESCDFFKSRKIINTLYTLKDVGLGYITLGQPLNTLSGGESQRVKIASRLRKKGEIYVLDEPTSGLHLADISLLMKLLHKLVKNGNTVILVEHNINTIINCDWIVDLGLEGGNKGGEIMASGSLLDIANCEESHTGSFIRKLLKD